MKPKYVVLTSLMLFLGAIASISYRAYELNRLEQNRGIALLETSTLGQVDSFSLEYGTNKVSFQKNANWGWVVTNTGFPAGESRVNDYLTHLTTRSTTDLISSSDGEAFGFNQPTILTFSSRGETISQIYAGNEHPGGGRYVKFSPSGPIYLVDPFVVDTVVHNWERHRIYEFSKNQIKKITVSTPRGKKFVEPTTEKPHEVSVLDALRSLEIHQPIAAGNQEISGYFRKALSARIELADGGEIVIDAVTNHQPKNLRAFVRMTSKDAKLNELGKAWFFEVSPNLERLLHLSPPVG